MRSTNRDLTFQAGGGDSIAAIAVGAGLSLASEIARQRPSPLGTRQTLRRSSRDRGDAAHTSR